MLHFQRLHLCNGPRKVVHVPFCCDTRKNSLTNCMLSVFFPIVSSHACQQLHTCFIVDRFHTHLDLSKVQKVVSLNLLIFYILCFDWVLSEFHCNYIYHTVFLSHLTLKLQSNLRNKLLNKSDRNG